MKDKAEQEWRRSVRRTVANTTYSAYELYLRSIPYLHLSWRKDILKVARTQSSLSSNTFLADSLAMYSKPAHTNHNLIPLDPPSKYTSPRHLISILSEGCHKDPVFSALVSNYCRSAPIFVADERIVNENRISSWEKEIEASTSSDRPQMLDYRPWFDEDDASRRFPVSLYTPENILLNSDIHRRLVEWRNNLAGTLLLPQTSSFRHLSRKTAYLYCCSKAGLDVGDDFEVDISARTIERYYADTGRIILGPTELRQAWKFNEITPRTYFALGGKTYHHSKYIRVVANSLCNAFPAINFRSRYSINNVDANPSRTVFTYDYSSFTSNLTELKYFLEELAQFCQGTPIRLLDSHVGPISYDLGDLIREYLTETVIHPEFSINRYLSHALEPLVHMKAGMLGVYGDIALSTSLHGLYGCNICGELECNCVGDDFFGSKVLDDMEEFVRSVEILGDINRQKFKFWTYQDPTSIDVDKDRWPFLKRPVFRYGPIMIHEVAVQLPIFGEVGMIRDPFRDARDEPITRILSRLATQARSLVRQIRVYNLDEDKLELIYEYMRSLYRVHEIPLEGNPPFINLYLKKYDITMSNWFLPSLRAFRSGDEWDGLFIGFEPRAIRVEKIQEEPFSPRSYLSLVDRDEIESPVSPLLLYLSHLGYGKIEPIYEDRFFQSPEMYMDFNERIFLKRVYTVCSFSLYRQITPWWLTSLCIELAISSN